MRFTSVKYDGKQVQLRWTVKIGEVTGSYGLTSSNEPSASFQDALRGLAEIALQILEFPRSVTNLKATGVSFSEDKHGVRGAVVTCIKHCRAAKVGTAINTPYLAERSETAAEAPGYYIDGMQEALDLIEAEWQARRLETIARCRQARGSQAVHSARRQEHMR